MEKIHCPSETVQKGYLPKQFAKVSRKLLLVFMIFQFVLYHIKKQCLSMYKEENNQYI